MQDTYDPFSYLLAEIRAYDAGLRPWEPALRDHYVEALLIQEAEELAWGRHHITIIHGPFVDEIERDLVDELYATILERLDTTEWYRVGGHPDHHITVTLEGALAEAKLAGIADLAARINPGDWRLVDSARAVVDC